MAVHGSLHQKGARLNDNVHVTPSSSTRKSGIGIAMFIPTWRTSCGCFLKYGGTATADLRGSRWMNMLGPCKRARATSFFKGRGRLASFIQLLRACHSALDGEAPAAGLHDIPTAPRGALSCFPSS